MLINIHVVEITTRTYKADRRGRCCLLKNHCIFVRCRSRSGKVALFCLVYDPLPISHAGSLSDRKAIAVYDLKHQRASALYGEKDIFYPRQRFMQFMIRKQSILFQDGIYYRPRKIYTYVFIIPGLSFPDNIKNQDRQHHH